MTVKLCMECFRKHFGADAKIKVVTCSAACGDCGKATPRRGTLIKADVSAEMIGKHKSKAPREAA